MSILTFIGDAILSVGSGSDSDTTTVHDVPTLSANQFLTNGLTIMYFLLGAIAIIIIIVSGIMYVTSAGNASSVTKAKNALTYAIVGLVVVLIAYAITAFVTGKFSS